MFVLTVAAGKGGTGKTTLAAHLGVEAQRCGDGPVAFIDADPQRSLTDWWTSRNAAGAPTILAPSMLSRFAGTLRELDRSGTNLVVIDTPPVRNDTIGVVIRAANLVLVPTRPSPHDFRAVWRTLDQVEVAGKPMVFVVNGATKRAKMTGEAAIVMSQHGRVGPIVHHRVDFASSMINGLTVGEINAASPSAVEIAKLWGYVNTQIRKHVNTRTKDHVNA